MKKINVHSLLIIAASIILLSSCSQVRQVTTSSNHKLHLIKADHSATATAKVVSPQVINKKELNSLPAKDHEIRALQEEKISGPKLRSVNSPMLHVFTSKESKTNTKAEVSNKNLQRVDQAIDRLDKINETSSSSNTENKLLPYGHSDAMKFLWLWVGALVLEIIFIALAVATLSLFFYVLAVLCGLAATIFFIIWLVKLFS